MKRIQLHVDLVVDTVREKDLATTFTEIFRPAIRAQPGFVDVTMLKVRSAPVAGTTHRLIISFETEEQRLRWVATDLHQQVWPRMEKNIESFTVLLFDLV